MLNLLFNTLLTITPHNTLTRRRRKERTTYGPSRRYSWLVTHPVLNPDRAVTKPSFAKVIARYVFLVLFVFPSCFKYLISSYYFDSTFAVKLIFSAFCNLLEKAHVV